MGIPGGHPIDDSNQFSRVLAFLAALPHHQCACSLPYLGVVPRVQACTPWIFAQSRLFNWLQQPLKCAPLSIAGAKGLAKTCAMIRKGPLGVLCAMLVASVVAATAEGPRYPTLRLLMSSQSCGTLRKYFFWLWW